MITDVLVIGAGIAGLSAAIPLLESGFKVTLVARELSPESSNSFWAQGGIIYPDGQGKQHLVDDIQAASSHTSLPEALEVLLQDGQEAVEHFLIKKIGVPFEKDAAGKLLLTKEAAHSVARILFQGDHTGSAIQQGLLSYLKKFDHQLTWLTDTTALDLITPSHHGTSLIQRYSAPQVLGAYLFDQKKQKVVKCLAKKVVLATGGVGGIYLNHTNSNSARGDGHAMALRAGAYVTNMEFIQFHPTAFYEPGQQRRFLISEALRGEGAYLLNSQQRRFMVDYHPDAELAPRDVVSRAILNELIKTGSDYVSLSIAHREGAWIKQRFPTIYQFCEKKGIDITQHSIPVVPAAHYSCGGVWVDSFGCTNLKNLYAVGEVSCTGLHGANRLASTSLLEGLVWGLRASKHILGTLPGEVLPKDNLHHIRDWVLGTQPVDLNLVAQDWYTLRQTMWNYVGIKRSKNRLLRAKAMINELSAEIDKFYKNSLLHDQLIGLRNSVEVASLMIKSSMQNQHSVGAFYLEHDLNK